MSPLTQGLNYRSACDRNLLSKGSVVKMDLFRQRRDRTVTVGCNEVLIRRDDLCKICVLQEVFGSDRSKILSVGELHPRQWEVVLSDDVAVPSRHSDIVRQYYFPLSRVLPSMIRKSSVTCRCIGLK